MIRNRLVALIYRSAAFSLSVFFLVYYAQFVASQGFNPNYVYNYWGYLSGLYNAIFFAVMTVLSAFDLRHGQKGNPVIPYMPYGLSVVYFSLINFFGYFVYLVPFQVNGFSFAEIALFILMPLLTVAEWILFEEKGTVKFNIVPIWVLLPGIYAAFELIRPRIWGDAPLYDGSFYPYHFMNFEDGGVGPTIGKLIIATALVTALAFLLIFLNDLLAGKFRKRVSTED